LNYLLPGDVMLADWGSDIGDSVGMMQAKLHIPAFTSESLVQFRNIIPYWKGHYL